MKPRVPLPRELRGRAFSGADAAAVGISKERLRGGDLQAPFRGVRSEGLNLEDPLARCHAFAVLMRDSWAFSHASAALIWRIPLPWRLEHDGRVHVAVPPATTQPRRRGVVAYRTSTEAAIRVGGLRVLPPLTVWGQLGGSLSLNEMVAAGDSLLGGRNPLSTLDEFAAYVSGCAGRREVERLRAALPLLREGVDSPKETELRMLLLAFGLPEPVVNRRYFDENGQYLGKPDLSWPLWRIVFEYEGDLHRTDRTVFRRDLERRERFESAGWSVIRVTDDALGSGRVVFERTVRARIRRQCKQLGLECAV